MQHKRGKEDYSQFMHWFEKHYPDLHIAYGQLIMAPVDGEGVTVEKDGLSVADYKKMVAITTQCYKEENLAD